AWFNHAQQFNQSFGYDALGQITSIDNSDGWQDISYDAIGNRLSLTTQADTDWYRSAFDSNRLLATTGEQQRQFDYDANGNIVSEQTAEGTVSYQYGRLNRMLSHSIDGQTTHYSYNAKGQRSAKLLADGSRIHYLYDQQGRMIAEASNGKVHREYIYQNGQLLALVNLTDAGNEVYYLSNDHLGRPEVATDKYGEVVWQAKNLAFDREVLIDNIGGLNLGLPGQYYDSEKDSWQNGFRDYDAKTARYMQSDPIGLAGGNNLYRYALNSSLIWFDETGLGPKDTGGDPSEPPRDSSSCGCGSSSTGGENWNQFRTNDGKIEVYRFGRWNETYQGNNNIIKDFASGVILTNIGGVLSQSLVGETIVFSWPVFLGSAFVGSVYTGYSGTRDFYSWQAENYSESEIEQIRAYNQSLQKCLGARDE
ncbi:RHS domain-containing protein, partial [Shewanella abyssi]|uniref:RHS repeat domain-containing protein n=1 Tax=Shewanella abyssi TaxID=311789 RepID=UPI00200D8869